MKPYPSLKDESLIFESINAESHSAFTKKAAGSIFPLKGGGAAFYSGPSSFFSQVIGWPLVGPAGFDFKQELREIEDFYRENAIADIGIEVTEYLNPDYLRVLSENNFFVSELTRILSLSLDEISSDWTLPEDIDLLDPQNETSVINFASAMSEGFGFESDLSENFSSYAKTPGHRVFVHSKGDQIAAGGGYFMQEGICDLGMASTRANFRGHGLQKLIIQARLLDAKKRGGIMAFSSAAPGSISYYNLLKMGFKNRYLRIKFTKEIRL